jgi:predicted acetyltransferase
MAFPPDLPVNRLLREPQLPHRPVEHLTASVAPQTRMQVRILDHQRFLESLHLPPGASGSATIAVHESEGCVSSFTLHLSDGRMKVTAATEPPEVECADHVWASIATGHLPVWIAASMKLIKVHEKGLPEALRALADGPAPFCREYF